MDNHRYEGRLHRRGLMGTTMAAGLFGLLLSPVPAGASWEPGWSVAPYAWIAGVDGSIGAPSGPAEPGGASRLDVDVDGALEEIGFMFYAEWRGERWLVLFDSVWADVSQDADLSIGQNLPGVRASAGIDGNVYLLAAGYRVSDWPNASLAGYAGLRYYDIDTSIALEGGLLPGPIETGSSSSWTDAVIGVRWSYRIGERWSLGAHADIGIGESDTSRQLAASAAYHYGWGAVVGGYRFLKLDAEIADYNVDLLLSGPMIGVSVPFGGG